MNDVNQYTSMRTDSVCTLLHNETLSVFALQASTLTFFLTCSFGQLTKKSTFPTQSFSCPNFFNKNDKNQRIIINNLCKTFWLLSLKHYLVLSLLILTDIMFMTSLIDKLTYIVHLEVRH